MNYKTLFHDARELKMTWINIGIGVYLSHKFQNWRVNAGSDIMCFTNIEINQSKK